eukprot:248571-Lingulodinium_polyedra.AAC.1
MERVQREIDKYERNSWAGACGEGRRGHLGCSPSCKGRDVAGEVGICQRKHASIESSGGQCLSSG